MTGSPAENAPKRIITIKNKALARIWGLSEAHASTQGRPAHLPGIKDGGIWLQKALQIRPIVVSEEEFEAILRAEATCLDGDPVEIARDEGLWTWNYSANPGRDLRGFRSSDHQKQRIEAESAEIAAQMRADAVAAQVDAERQRIEQAVADMPDAPARRVAGDLLAEARLKKLEADIERASLKARKESGELIEKAEVEAALTHAGAVIRSAFNLLPGQIADLVPDELRSEVRKRVEDRIDRALHAVANAFLIEDEDA